MTTSWSIEPGGTVVTRLRPGLVVRAIGLVLLGAGCYFVWQFGGAVVDLVRARSGVGPGDLVGLVLVVVMAAALGVPGGLLAFFGAGARVEPLPRRVVVRAGAMGLGTPKSMNINASAVVVVRLQVDHQTSTSGPQTKVDYTVATYRVTVEQDGSEPAEIGQFGWRQGDRARRLAEAAAGCLAVPVADRARPAELAVPEEDRQTSEFLERHGVSAPPRGFRVRAIQTVRLLIETLFTS
jgi:hypothetical protein